MFSFFKKGDEETAILMDVGSGTLTGALVVFAKNQRPKFIQVTKKKFSNNKKLKVEKLQLEMNTLLDELLSSVIGKGLKHKHWNGNAKIIDGVLISFSSPWFISKTKVINLANDKEFVISKSFLNNILTKEIDVLKSDLEIGGDSCEVIEKSIVQGKINGYVMTNSIGKTTKKFDASMYLSVVDSHFLKNVLSIIHKHTNIDDSKISINTFPLVSFTVFRDLFTKESNFLIMDITDEITDITLVEADIIKRTASLPSGKNFIIRQISKTLDVSTQIAESNLQMYITKKIDYEMMSKISDILVEVEKKWSIYLEKALLEISPKGIFPRSLYLTSDNEIASVYIDFLSIKKLDSTSTFRNNLKINQINLEKMKNFYDNESGFALNEFIVILALFYKKIINSKL